MALLDDVKKALRITNTAYDTEIQDIIDSAKIDLDIAGIYSTLETDPLIKRAITTYVKAEFGYGENAERFQKSYEMMKERIAMAEEYSYYAVTFNTGEQCEVTFDGTTKETNDLGEVVFHTRAKNHIPYSYLSTSGYIDVTADTTVGG
jgi:uncharacterized phage protein (predicted DNA packaging)